MREAAPDPRAHFVERREQWPVGREGPPAESGLEVPFAPLLGRMSAALQPRDDGCEQAVDEYQTRLVPVSFDRDGHRLEGDGLRQRANLPASTRRNLCVRNG